MTPRTPTTAREFANRITKHSIRVWDYFPRFVDDYDMSRDDIADMRMMSLRKQLKMCSKQPLDEIVLVANNEDVFANWYSVPLNRTCPPAVMLLGLRPYIVDLNENDDNHWKVRWGINELSKLRERAKGGIGLVIKNAYGIMENRIFFEREIEAVNARLEGERVYDEANEDYRDFM